jgi:hypothetical protein
MKTTRFCYWPLALALLFPTLLLSGCGRTGKLSGKVVYQGNPVPNAKIVFLCDNGRLLDATADENGRYSVAGVPIGRVRVGVKNFTEGMAEGMAQFMQKQATAQGGKEKAAGDIQQSAENMMKNISGGKGGSSLVLLPPKAIDPEKSGIEFEVKGGSQDQDIVVPIEQ